MGSIDLYQITTVEQEPLNIPDCNTCVFVDKKENEEHVRHYCNRYNKRVFHRTSNIKHDSHIWPCRDCTVDGHSNYLRSMTNEEAAEVLEKSFLQIIPARGNGKTITMLRYNEAIMKVISLLRETPDK